MKLYVVLHILALALSTFAFTPYTVERCVWDAIRVQSAIRSARTALILPKADTVLGTTSATFAAMFKSFTSIIKVQTLFENILNQAPLSAGRNIRFFCATSYMSAREKDSLGYDPWAICTELRVTSFWRKDNLIWVCPSFMSLPPQPALGPQVKVDKECPIVFDNRFYGKINDFINYQCYDIVRQLVYVYLQDQALDATTIPRGELDWNACIRSRIVDPNGAVSLRDPMNYVYYAACMSLSVLCDFSSADSGFSGQCKMFRCS